MELNEVQHADFRENGFMVVRNVLSPEEVETLRQRADEIISDVETYRQRDTAERQRLQELHKQDVEELPRYNTFAEQPEERITGRYARRGDRVYPVRQRPVDEAAVAAAQASDNPWQRFGGTLDHLADNDAVFRKFAAHPNVVKVLQELLAPNLKLWFDHLYNKPPYNNSGPYGGANRFHHVFTPPGTKKAPVHGGFDPPFSGAFSSRFVSASNDAKVYIRQSYRKVGMRQTQWRLTVNTLAKAPIAADPMATTASGISLSNAARAIEPSSAVPTAITRPHPMTR